MIPAPVLDRAVRFLLTLLHTENLEAERLIRMGAHGCKNADHAARRVGYACVNSANSGLRWRELPPTGRLLVWGRLIAAMHLWQPSPKASKGAEVSLEDVADRLGFGNGAVVSNSLLYHAGIYPRAWHLSGETLDHLCHRFVRTWRERSSTEVAA